MARRPLLKRIIDSFGSVPATIRFSEPLPASASAFSGGRMLLPFGLAAQPLWGLTCTVAAHRCCAHCDAKVKNAITIRNGALG